MKAKAILLASVVSLAGCQSAKQEIDIPTQHAQSLSSASQSNGVVTYPDSPFAYQDDLWGYISDGLAMKVPDNYRVREQMNRYLKKKSDLHDVALRAEPYLYSIVEQVHQRHMPMEVVMIPIVESAFNPHVKSYAGAAGLWQIIPSTGRSFGLRDNRWYDGRRDVTASTNAALNYLEYLNEEFNGNWLLTLAAYNCGEGRVKQAIRANERRGLPTDFWSLRDLPRQTREYVPKVLALSKIFADNERYGVNLPETNSGRALARVKMKKQVNLAEVANVTGLSLNQMRNFNPGYKRNTSAPDGPHYVMVPRDSLPLVVDAMHNNTLTTSAQTTATQTAALTTTTYRVRSGDTLSGIAAGMGVTTRQLAQWNDIRLSHVLSIGETLKIDNQNTMRSNNTQLAKTTSNAAKNATITYRVREGDSVYSIAERHGVSTKDIIRWNSVLDKSTVLQPGEQLTLYVNNTALPNS